jgi:hypothetical protein
VSLTQTSLCVSVTLPSDVVVLLLLSGPCLPLPSTLGLLVLAQELTEESVTKFISFLLGWELVSLGGDEDMIYDDEEELLGLGPGEPSPTSRPAALCIMYQIGPAQLYLGLIVNHMWTTELKCRPSSSWSVSPGAYRCEQSMGLNYPAPAQLSCLLL